MILLLDCLSYSLHVLDAGASAPTVAVLSASSRPPPNRVAGPAVREALAAISPAVSLFRLERQTLEELPPESPRLSLP